MDSAGNLYIADTQNHRVRKVTGGTISHGRRQRHRGLRRRWRRGTARAAQPAVRRGGGCGRQSVYRGVRQQSRAQGRGQRHHHDARRQRSHGYSGDGGSAASAMLNGPQSVAVDGRGNVYIADTANNRVRRVTRERRHHHGGRQRPRPATPAMAVRRSSAQVGNPVAVAVDSAGNVYIADGSARVRKLFRVGPHHDHRRQRDARATRAMAASRPVPRLNGPVGAGGQFRGQPVCVADSFNNAVRAAAVLAAALRP